MEHYFFSPFRYFYLMWAVMVIFKVDGGNFVYNIAICNVWGRRAS